MIRVPKEHAWEFMQWKKMLLQKLCFGYIRKEMSSFNVRTDDIASLVLSLLEDFDLQFIFFDKTTQVSFDKYTKVARCSFNKYIESKPHSLSSVVFSQFISDLLYGDDRMMHCKRAIGHQYNLNNNCVTFRITLETIDSRDSWFRNGGYHFEIGLFCFPKMMKETTNHGCYFDEMEYKFHCMNTIRLTVENKHKIDSPYYDKFDDFGLTTLSYLLGHQACDYKMQLSGTMAWSFCYYSDLGQLFNSFKYNVNQMQDLRSKLHKIDSSNRYSLAMNGYTKNDRLVEKDQLLLSIDFGKNSVSVSRYNHITQSIELVGTNYVSEDMIFDKGNVSFELKDYYLLFGLTSARSGINENNNACQAKGFVFDVDLLY